jgi:hypothetical protein
MPLERVCKTHVCIYYFSFKQDILHESPAWDVLVWYLFAEDRTACCIGQIVELDSLLNGPAYWIGQPIGLGSLLNRTACWMGQPIGSDSRWNCIACLSCTAELFKHPADLLRPSNHQVWVVENPREFTRAGHQDYGTECGCGFLVTKCSGIGTTNLCSCMITIMHAQLCSW